MESPRERWFGVEAGPLVRPYAITRGRTSSGGIRFDLVSIVAATGKHTGEHIRLTPEQRRLLTLCRRPCTLADLASEVKLPLGVVKVLLGDLHHHGLIAERRAAPASARPDPELLLRVLHDLRAL